MPDIKDIKVFKPDQSQIEQAKTWPVWSCDVSTFDWEYTQSERCLIVEGSVVVKSSDQQEQVIFGEGDMVIFPDGLSCVWDVKEPVKKHYKFD